MSVAAYMELQQKLHCAEYEVARLKRAKEKAEQKASAVHTPFGEYHPKRPLTVGGWAGACFDFLLRHPVTEAEKMDRAAIAYGGYNVTTEYGRALIGLKRIHKSGADQPQAEPLYRLAEDMGDKWSYVYKVGVSAHVARFPKDAAGIKAARQYVTFLNSLEA
ncbi:hypothetical protein [Stenotrophomonas phage vB_SmaS_P15]|uniref:Uncharacterized protein n=1 Tax=Stenotrophomonas phage vB_SmaS_P15 TaxID=2894592 RepID=A0AAE8YFN6_9CAUD|nr:hypothetical protein [Stenotrophomonas phage vB_SmaS_P15]